MFYISNLELSGFALLLGAGIAGYTVLSTFLCDQSECFNS